MKRPAQRDHRNGPSRIGCGIRTRETPLRAYSVFRGAQSTALPTLQTAEAEPQPGARRLAGSEALRKSVVRKRDKDARPPGSRSVRPWVTAARYQARDDAGGTTARAIGGGYGGKLDRWHVEGASRIRDPLGSSGYQPPRPRYPKSAFVMPARATSDPTFTPSLPTCVRARTSQL